MRNVRGAVALAQSCIALCLSAALAHAGDPSPASPPVAAAAATVAARPSKGCARTSIETGRRLVRTITVDGVERRFILDVPETIKAGEPAALMFDFHGIGHSGGGVWEVSAFREMSPRERFITVYPDGLQVEFTRGDRRFAGPGWEIRSLSPNRDVDFTIAMLDQLESDYCIDRARVYSTGFSNGGFFSHVLACTHAERFAAVAPVSGGWLAWSCKPSRPIPVLIHHGRQDDVIDVAEARKAHQEWLAIDGCAPSAAKSPPDASGTSCTASAWCRDDVVVEYCEGDFAHRWPPPATARIWEFLAAHPLPPSGSKITPPEAATGEAASSGGAGAAAQSPPPPR